jgi:hypothetical protein
VFEKFGGMDLDPVAGTKCFGITGNMSGNFWNILGISGLNCDEAVGDQGPKSQRDSGPVDGSAFVVFVMTGL